MKVAVLLLLALCVISHALPAHKKLPSRLRASSKRGGAVSELSEAETQHKTAKAKTTTHALSKWSLLPGENAVTRTLATAQGKRPVHEGIMNDALALIPGHGITVDSLRKGLLWNDLPGPIPNDYLEVALMARDFLAGSDNDLVYATHKGCLQFWHAMSPRSGNLRFTPANVQQFMIAAAQFWWGRAVAVRTTSVADWWVGHILHAIQDSYSPSHTLRGTENVLAEPGVPASPNAANDARGANCGKIHMYQDYSGQDGGAHDDAEKDPTQAAQAPVRQCAMYMSWRFLHLWNQCKTTGACDFGPVSELLTKLIWVYGGTLTIAGGTVDTFKARSASGLTSQTITVGSRTVAVSVPTTDSAHPMWNDQNAGIYLCPHTTMQASTPGGPRGFPDPANFDNPRTSPRGDFPVPSDGPSLAVNGAVGPPMVGKAF